MKKIIINRQIVKIFLIFIVFYSVSLWAVSEKKPGIMGLNPVDGKFNSAEPIYKPVKDGASTEKTDKTKKTSIDEEKLRKIEEEFDLQKKDPLLAGVLSYYTPGLGQLYAEAPLKGAIYFVLDSSLLLAAVFSIADLDLVANSDTGLNIGIHLKKNELGEIPDSNIRIAAAFGIMWFCFRVWNIVDALETTKDLNMQIYKRIEIQYNAQSYKLQEERKNDERHYLTFQTRF
jgi:TM2 domain-containing membrane protein YozV